MYASFFPTTTINTNVICSIRDPLTYLRHIAVPIHTTLSMYDSHLIGLASVMTLEVLDVSSDVLATHIPPGRSSVYVFRYLPECDQVIRRRSSLLGTSLCLHWYWGFLFPLLPSKDCRLKSWFYLLVYALVKLLSEFMWTCIEDDWLQGAACSIWAEVGGSISKVGKNRFSRS
jgi:hypothetical protein